MSLEEGPEAWEENLEAEPEEQPLEAEPEEQPEAELEEQPEAGHEAQPLQGETKTKNRVSSLLLIVLAVLLIGTGTWIGVAHWPRHHEGQLVDLDNNPITPEDPTATSSPFLEAANMVPDDGGDGFQVPKVKLDVPIGSVNDVNGVMNPANFTSVFWVRNRGVSLDNAEQGTVFMVTHAVQGGKAPGNILQNKGLAALSPGDLIKVNQRTYEFVSSEVIPKAEIGNHEDLWANDPGRMLVITCVLNPNGGLAVDNLVIVAKLVS